MGKSEEYREWSTERTELKGGTNSWLTYRAYSTYTEIWFCSGSSMGHEMKKVRTVEHG